MKSRKPEAEYLITSDFGDRLEVVGGADDVVGDDVRQMRDDGEHLVVMVGVHRVDVRAAAPPEFGQLFERSRIGVRQRREDAPAVLEQIGKAGVRAGLFRAGERMAGDEMDAVQEYAATSAR